MAILCARFIYMLEIWKLRFHYIIWHSQGHTDINQSGSGLSDSCNLHIPCCTTLLLFYFGNNDSGMNETCSALLDAIGHSHYVFKFPREMTIDGIKKKNPLSTSRIYECVNEYFKNVSINIKCGF